MTKREMIEEQLNAALGHARRFKADAQNLLQSVEFWEKRVAELTGALKNLEHIEYNEGPSKHYPSGEEMESVKILDGAIDDYRRKQAMEDLAVGSARRYEAGDVIKIGEGDPGKWAKDFVSGYRHWTIGYGGAGLVDESVMRVWFAKSVEAGLEQGRAESSAVYARQIDKLRELQQEIALLKETKTLLTVKLDDQGNVIRELQDALLRPSKAAERITHLEDAANTLLRTINDQGKKLTRLATNIVNAKNALEGR